LAATHHEHWTPVHVPALSVGRKRREARRRRRLTEIEGFLDELHGDLGDRPSTLIGALEGYRRTLRAGRR
jgi:hypothetical protein